LIARGPARRARTTSAGRQFGMHARAILSSVSDAVESLHDDTSMLQGPLRIGCIPTAGPRMIPATASSFVSRHPHLDLAFVEAHPMTIQRMVLNGEVDVAVMYRKQVQPLHLHLFAIHVLNGEVDVAVMYRKQVQMEGLVQHSLAEVQLHALVSADHRLADRSGVDVGELVDDPVILLDSPPTADLLINQIRSLGYEPSVRWLLPNAETIRSMVGWGLGFSLANAVPHPNTLTFEG